MQYENALIVLIVIATLLFVLGVAFLASYYLDKSVD